MNRKQRDANRQTARDARRNISLWSAGPRNWQRAALLTNPERATLTIDALRGKALFSAPYEPRMQDPSVVGRRARAHLAEIFGTSAAPDPLPAKILIRATPLDIAPGPFLMAWDESDQPVDATAINGMLNPDRSTS